MSGADPPLATIAIVTDSAVRDSLGYLDVGRSTSSHGRRMARELTQRELRNESGDIMRRLDEGESFVVTRNGVPVAELTPLRRRRFVAAEAAMEMFRTAPTVDHDRFRADLDRVAVQDPEPRG